MKATVTTVLSQLKSHGFTYEYFHGVRNIRIKLGAHECHEAPAPPHSLHPDPCVLVNLCKHVTVDRFPSQVPN